MNSGQTSCCSISLVQLEKLFNLHHPSTKALASQITTAGSPAQHGRCLASTSGGLRSTKGLAHVPHGGLAMTCCLGEVLRSQQQCIWSVQPASPHLHLIPKQHLPRAHLPAMQVRFGLRQTGSCWRPCPWSCFASMSWGFGFCLKSLRRPHNPPVPQLTQHNPTPRLSKNKLSMAVSVAPPAGIAAPHTRSQDHS